MFGRATREDKGTSSSGAVKLIKEQIYENSYNSYYYCLPTDLILYH